jgi:ubiquinone/menaquinone biosynthesis C-methylase UbiE
LGSQKKRSGDVVGDGKKISRVIRSKAEAQATYDKIARWYDLLEGTWERGARGAGLRKLDAKAGERVLEIGFGPGHDLITIARSVGETGRVYGIDLSPRMIRIARARINDNGLGARVNLTRGDAVRLPFETGSFDALFMSFTLELFDTPEIPLVLAECRRVLRRGGRICVVSLSGAGRSSWMKNLYEWGHEKFPKLLDCRPIYVEKALSDSGLRIQDAILTSVRGLPVEVVLAFAAELTSGDDPPETDASANDAPGRMGLTTPEERDG